MDEGNSGNGARRWRWGIIIAALGIGGPVLGLYAKNTADIAVNHTEIVHMNAELLELQKDIGRLEDRLNNQQCPGAK